jgi:hypothetical protein
MAGFHFTSSNTSKRERDGTTQVKKEPLEMTLLAAKAKKVFRGKSESLGPRLTIEVVGLNGQAL